MKKFLLLLATHAIAAAVGFAGGIYVLPILTAPPSPDAEEVRAASSDALFRGKFRRDLEGSDLLHWGEGDVAVTRKAVSHMGRLAPGPDYKLYLSPKFVETEEQFHRLKDRMVRVGDVKTFTNFVVPLSDAVDPGEYTTVVVWCESFDQFITSAKYR